MTTPHPMSSVKRNYFFGGLSAFVGAVFPLVTLSYSARVLGPESLGKYYFASSLSTYFMFLACMGIPVYGVREIGKARGDAGRLRQVFRELFAINLFASVAVWAAYVVVVLAVPHFRDEAFLFGVFGLLLLNNGFNLDYLYTGLERQDFLAYRSIASKVISLVLLFTLVRHPGDHIWLAGIAVFTGVLNNALTLRGFAYMRGASRGGGLFLKRHFKPLALLTLSLVLTNVYISLDSVLLGVLSTAREVGLYNAAIRPSRTGAVLLSSIMVVAMPRLAFLLSDEKRSSHDDLRRKTFEAVFLVALPVAFALMASSGAVIAILYGEKFSQATFALTLGAPLLVINTLTAFQGYLILLPRHKDGSMALVAGVAAAAGLIANFALIPLFGHVGAVGAALIAESCALLAQIVIIRKMGDGHRTFSRAIATYFGCAFAMAIAQWACLRGSVSVPYTVAVWCVTGAGYLAVLALMRDRIVLGLLRAAGRKIPAA